MDKTGYCNCNGMFMLYIQISQKQTKTNLIYKTSSTFNINWPRTDLCSLFRWFDMSMFVLFVDISFGVFILSIFVICCPNKPSELIELFVIICIFIMCYFCCCSEWKLHWFVFLFLCFVKIAFLGLTSLLIWQFKAISVDLSSLVIVLLYLSRNHMDAAS